VKQAQIEGYRCRSAYKLLEINQKHNLLKKGSIIVSMLLFNDYLCAHMAECMVVLLPLVFSVLIC